MNQRLGLMVFMVLGLAQAAACGKDKADDTASATTTGNGSGSGDDGTTDTSDPVLVHDSEYALVVQNEPVYTAVQSTAEYHVELTPETVSGFILYTEQDDSGTELCSAVLTMRPEAFESDPHDTGSAPVVPTPDCDGCTMGHFAHTDVSVTSGDCAFGSSFTALDQASEFFNASGTFAIYDNADSNAITIDMFDSAGEIVQIIDITGPGTATFSSGALTGENTDSGNVLNHWRSCSQSNTGAINTLTPGEISLIDTLACPSGVAEGTPTVSIWERDLAFGQQVTAGILTSVDAVDLYLRTPDGCLSTVQPSPISCVEASTGASALCQSLEHKVAQGGPHAILVVHRGCTAAGLDYRFDARVQTL